MSYLSNTDPNIYELINDELKRQQNGLEMIPSENFTSPAVLEALGSVLTNKYSEGYPGKRYYGGNQVIDQVEETCRNRAKELFGVAHANVQPYSGSPANQAVYFALLNPGDTVLGMELAQGGHLTHGYKLNFSGKYYHSVSYGVDRETKLLNYEAIREIAKKEKPKLIVCGATAYPRQIDFSEFKKIANEVNSYLLADISHIVGLIIAGTHQSPVPYADVIMTTTHKTLRGPRGAMILLPKVEDRLHELYHSESKRNLAELIDAAIIPGLQGGPHNHQTAAIAVALKEAMTDEFKNYGRQIVANAKSLAESLIENGLELVTGGTDNHLILVDLTKTGLSGAEAEKLLDEVSITVNKNMIPFDPRKPLDPSGIRLGTPALTTRGFTENDMQVIGKTIAEIIKNPINESIKMEARRVVAELTTAHPLYQELV
ncbi:serine hydroxymethyltransferase [Candidatus Uhrbacteria bacterium RIFCSPLOWO2_02_FULL_48_12]|uniref:Serine hydroxymethyltransferase n=1 Tax=Candidatus Uhrbacteria bacterium RIFCSPLOWO2_02_FULL_48_12 TaxID=1802407 RepID=A0A1F7V9I7_9BACT|nr:MAG: serine hydroxymethyltransferase [Candidatus Uhrbacteria bacterium RIFCSPLOWO2_02_FULL_48_12]